MTTLPLCERLRAAQRDLVRAAAARAQAEQDTEAGFLARQQAADQEYQEAQAKIQALHQAAVEGAEHQVQEARKRIAGQFEQDHAVATQEFSRGQSRARHHYDMTKEKLQADFKESRWTITTLYDSDKKVAREQRAHTERASEAALVKCGHLVQESRKQLAGWKMADLDPIPLNLPVGGEEDPCRALQQCSALAAKKFQELKDFGLPRFLKKFPWLCALGWLLTTAPAWLIDEWYFWVPISTGLALLVWLLGKSWLTKKCRAGVSTLFRDVVQHQADAVKMQSPCWEQTKAIYRRQRAESKKRHQESLDQAMGQCRRSVKEARRQRERDLQKAQEIFASRLEEITQTRRHDLDQAETTYQRQLAEAQAVRDSELRQAHEKFTRLQDENNRRHAQEWTRLALAWKQALDQFQGVVQEIDGQCRRWFPSWDDPVWDRWRPPAAIPQGMLFGKLAASPERIPQGVPRDANLPRLHLDGLPALLPFPQRASLMVRARDDGREHGVSLLQALLLRFLTAIPPGKVRFTIIDPVGRGENFAAFMHLADFEEQLVTSRIWTESTHIEQRLSDLTNHMEIVIQKYLRNQYQTLEEYNALAEEVAEPFRVLVVANFPVNFSAEAARRLVSLASSGARCGIYTLVSVDTRQPVPQGFSLTDLEQVCLKLDWKDKEFVWPDPDFSLFPLEPDRPPAAELSTRLLQVIGKQAKAASRVEVPFDYVAPIPEQWWTGDSRLGIAVALGRAGATGKQLLQLGQGTAQHALVSGKTGSGKSTLLHALITQIALTYSPDEVELYLIDFKKGVEFKTYASHELPHARVVAVESEREFGLSVLQRLDAELKFRGERFRKQGVNDLNSYRQALAAASLPPLSPDGQEANSKPSPILEEKGRGEGDGKMPRILLVIDEFQEFFVEDDKVAQESALLLDRLVRQGRAFGIHVLLGSQTLGGAYSLARSTIDQMAVRIALQCSEADAHLILGKDNGAARLLSRPGEAIYNAAGGLLEGNNLFQVVWLSDERRDRALQGVADLARQRQFIPPGPQIVFEGTAPADLPKNPHLERLVKAYPPPAAPAVFQAWLGEAIAIKDPTAAVFRRQSGSNLLLVGQQSDMAFRMMVSSLISLACQLPAGNGGQPSAEVFYFVVGSSLEAAEEEMLARVTDLLGPQIRQVAIRDLPAVIGALADEVERRLKEPGNPEPLFLFLHGLHRLRDLRRSEDDFGFSRRGEGKQLDPPRQFLTILREGPVAGVHTLVWCDNLNNLQRALERQALREFEMRVLGQMSAADSSNLIDSPLAARLGMHRALFATEEQGRLEKFRPYGLPPADWLEWLGSRLLARNVPA